MMTPETAQLAAAMDEALTDPESLKALLDYMDHPAVKAIMDTPERRQRLAAMAAMIESEVDSANEAGGSGGPTAPVEVPDWIRLGMIAVATAWVADEVRTCMHNLRPDGAVPGWAVAWKPDLVVCPECLHLLEAGGVEEFRCDCCGRISLPKAGGVGYTTVATDSLLYRAGACPSCWTGLNAAA